MSKCRRLSRGELPTISRYAFAVLSVAMAIGATELLTRVLLTEPIASSMLCAVICAAWFGGFGPGLVAIALSLFAMHYYLVAPINTFALKQNIFAVGIPELPRLALFSVTSLFVNFSTAAQKRARDAAFRAEAQAARAEREIRLVTDSIPALVWVAFPDGAVEYVNERWLAYTGMTLEQARGWGFIDAVHAEDRQSVRSIAAVRIQHGVTANEVKVEARLRGVGGKYRWFLGSAVALRDEVGNIVRWYGTNIDIEDRKRAEDALRRSEAYLAEAQRLSRTGSFGWKIDGRDIRSRDIFWSEEMYRIFGVDRSLKPSIELSRQRIHPDDREVVLREVARAAAGHSAFDIEHRLLMPDGAVKYLHVMSHHVKFEWGDGEIVGAVMDITAAKEAQEALQAAQAELAHVARLTTVNALGTSIAHEVNQPLAAIITNAEACLRWIDLEVPDLEEARIAVKRIVYDGHRAGNVIRGVRALSSKARSQRALLDMNSVINEVIPLVRRELMSHRVSLRMDLAPIMPAVFADRVQLQQVIINLVINAIEAMEEVTDGRRELTVRSDSHGADQVSVCVKDSGVGIRAENANRLFDAFVTTKANGMGMGLSICRSIIQAHGGDIWTEPNLTEGAAFYFTLPSHQNNVT